MGCLVFSCSRCCGSDFTAVSRSQRQYAGPPRNGNHGTRPETALLVRKYGVRSGTGERVSWNTTEVAAILQEDRKSTRLNSSHVEISYAVFCLKKKKITHCCRVICADSALAGILEIPQ